MKKILVVDSNDQIRASITEALILDYKVEEAADGEEAIEKLTQRDFDLVTLEINLPGTCGWETLRIIKDDDNGWPDLNVVVLTVNREPENVLKAWSLGALYYVTKPFAISQLLEVVRNTFLPETHPV